MRDLQGGSQYDPYNRLKQSLGQMAVGRLQGASQAVQGRMGQQGISDVPGVQQAYSTRMQSQLMEGLGGTYAGIDQQARQEGEQKRQFGEQMAFAKKQWEESKSAAERAFWGEILGGIFGAAGKIGAAYIGGTPAPKVN